MYLNSSDGVRYLFISSTSLTVFFFRFVPLMAEHARYCEMDKQCHVSRLRA